MAAEMPPFFSLKYLKIASATLKTETQAMGNLLADPDASCLCPGGGQGYLIRDVPGNHEVHAMEKIASNQKEKEYCHG